MSNPKPWESVDRAHEHAFAAAMSEQERRCEWCRHYRPGLHEWHENTPIDYCALGKPLAPCDSYEGKS